MPRSFRFPASRKTAMRTLLGILLAANGVAALLAFFPLGGSVESVESSLLQAGKTLAARQQQVRRLKENLDKVRRARAETEAFLAERFYDRERAYSEMELALADAVKASGLQAKDRTYGYEPVEGSDQLGIAVINANFEGNYADLLEAIQYLDRSAKLVILDQLQAQPQQATGLLAVNLKLYAFLIESAAEKTAPEEMAAAGGSR